MKGRSISEWQSLAAISEEEWGRFLRANIKECIDKTDTSVVSVDLSDHLTLGEGPFAGVPYGLKDLFDVDGVATHASSVVPDMLGMFAGRDSELVERMKGLGGTCVVKTQMNEFAYGLSGENPHYGDCPHPRMHGCLSGGSSSGSAHLVAAGYVPLAFGTDTGGSIRLPAAWCGIYGIRWVQGIACAGGFPAGAEF